MALSLFPLACGPAEPMVVAPDATPAPPLQASPQKDGPFTVTQVFGPHYAPGMENKVPVTMNYGGSEPVTALALQIKLPLGWQFGGLQDGAKPAIIPETGATDTITMVWVQAPDFPATLTYTVRVPDWAEGTHTVEAQALYRSLGGERQSPVSRVTAKKAPQKNTR
ncbi:MAG: hypothetical protein L3K26_11610 [Candidatus Hydrogenedentes bacterium]|nr:hypothetical protein [Candidatus Hydrogenedentota bacterium]